MAGIGAAVVTALGVGLSLTYVTATSQDTVAPTRLDADPLTPTSAKISWRSTGATKYVVTVGSDRAFTLSKRLTVPGTKSSLTLEDLKATTPGSDQFFRVEAVDGDTVVSSRTERFTLLPGEMSKVRVARASADGTRIGWDKVANARQYDVVVAKDDTFTERVVAGRTLGSIKAFAVDGLKSDTKYWVRMRPVNGDLVGEWGKPVDFKTGTPKVTFRVGTWNVCSEKCSGYAGRARIMADFLNLNKVDLFALQEAGGKRVGPTTNAIFSGGSQGFVRATGGAKARYIFYRPALFDQVSGGFFPVGHGRHATWAKFTTKKTKRPFYVVDVHLENGHGNDRKRAIESRSMLSTMASINPNGDPIIYAGDFNSGRHRSADSPGTLMRGAGMVDTRDVAKNPENAGINTGHSPSGGLLRSGDHVDHVFASRQFSVEGWKQLVRLSGSGYAKPFVSDHNAVSAVVGLDTKKVEIGKLTPSTPIPDVAVTSK